MIKSNKIHPASIHNTKITINNYSVIHPASIKSIFEIKYHKYKSKYLSLKILK